MPWQNVNCIHESISLHMLFEHSHTRTFKILCISQFLANMGADQNVQEVCWKMQIKFCRICTDQGWGQIPIPTMKLVFGLPGIYSEVKFWYL